MGAWPEKAALLDLDAAAPSAPSGTPGGLDLVSAKVPWGTEWIGKTSDMDGYYTNMRVRITPFPPLPDDCNWWLITNEVIFVLRLVQVPFYKSFRLTAQLPAGHAPFSVCECCICPR